MTRQPGLGLDVNLAPPARTNMVPVPMTKSGRVLCPPCAKTVTGRHEPFEAVPHAFKCMVCGKAIA